MQRFIQHLDRGFVGELYLTATGDCASAFSWAREMIETHHARVLRQRAFVPDGELPRWIAAHESAHGAEADSIATSWLEAGDSADVGGLQIHAIRSPGTWKPLTEEGKTRGWGMEIDGHKWAITAGIQCSGADGPTQTRMCFESGEAMLRQAGMGLADVARTWIYMDDVLNWYGSFNQARNALFIQRGLLDRERRDASLVPASTGMGVKPIGGGRLCVEMLAVSEGIKRFAAAGRQRCAYEYGSAFTRATQAPTPAGSALYISGTAAISEQGETCHLNDAAGQIRMTVENLLAVIRSTGHDPRKVVEAIAYCKTPAVADLFRSRWQGELPWPWIVVMGDVCRSELLFEAEATVAVRQLTVS